MSHLFYLNLYIIIYQLPWHYRSNTILSINPNMKIKVYWESNPDRWIRSPLCYRCTIYPFVENVQFVLYKYNLFLHKNFKIAVCSFDIPKIRGGVEPPIFCVLSRRLNQLDHRIYYSKNCKSVKDPLTFSDF